MKRTLFDGRAAIVRSLLIGTGPKSRRPDFQFASRRESPFLGPSQVRVPKVEASVLPSPCVA
jgi:hypothetical protein